MYNPETESAKEASLRSLTVGAGSCGNVSVRPLQPVRGAVGGLRERCYMYMPDVVFHESHDTEPKFVGDFAREVDYGDFEFLDADPVPDGTGW